MPRDVDVAAGQREGVDLGAVDDGEMPAQLGPVRVARQALADGVDIGLDLRVLVRTVIGEHLPMLTRALGDLVAFGHHRPFDPAGHGVLDARAGEQTPGERERNQGVTHGCLRLSTRAQQRVTAPAALFAAQATGMPAGGRRSARRA